MDLGALIGEYPVDNERRGTHGLVLTSAGVVALAIGVPLMIAGIERPFGPGESPSSAPKFLGGVVAIGLLLVIVGVVLLIRTLQTRGRTIRLHEQGIVRSAGDAEESLAWKEIATVRIQGAEQNRAGHYVGIDFRCAVQLQDGRRFAFSSFTTKATELATALRDAVHGGMPPAGP